MCIISSAALLLDNWGCNYRNEVISNYRVSSSSLMSEEVRLIVGFLLRRTQLLFICLERCTFGPCDLWRSMVGCRFCTNWCNEALCYCRSIDGFHSRHGSFFFRVNQPGGEGVPAWIVLTCYDMIGGGTRVTERVHERHMHSRRKVLKLVAGTHGGRGRATMSVMIGVVKEQPSVVQKERAKEQSKKRWLASSVPSAQTSQTAKSTRVFRRRLALVCSLLWTRSQAKNLTRWGALLCQIEVLHSFSSRASFLWYGIIKMPSYVFFSCLMPFLVA